MQPVRPDDWKREPMPDRHTVLALDRPYAPEQMRAIRLGLLPEAMEDKWFLYFEDDRLHFHRSWTGHCIFVARFEPTDDGGAVLADALVNRVAEQYRNDDDAHDARMIVSLIDMLLLGRVRDLPTRSATDTQRAVESWSEVGRAGLGQGPRPGRKD